MSEGLGEFGSHRGCAFFSACMVFFFVIKKVKRKYFPNRINFDSVRPQPTKPGRIVPGPIVKREQTATIRPFSVTKSVASTSENNSSPNRSIRNFSNFSDSQRKETEVGKFQFFFSSLLKESVGIVLAPTNVYGPMQTGPGIDGNDGRERKSHSAIGNGRSKIGRQRGKTSIWNKKKNGRSKFCFEVFKKFNEN